MFMGASIGRGSLIAGLVGIAVEAIGAKNADKVAAHLDIAGCRAAKTSLEIIELRRATLAQILRDEQRYSLQLETGYLADAKKQKDLKPDPDGELPFATAKDIEQVKALSVEQLARDNARLFDALVANANLPYSNAEPVLPPENEVNPFTRGTYLWAAGSYRLNFERPIVQNRLLHAAFELRAQKLNLGEYPAQFVAPIDPFSPGAKPLIYKKTASSYLLYSVGPNGKDDGGAKIQTVIKDEVTGATTISAMLTPDSTGDVVQLPF